MKDKFFTPWRLIHNKARGLAWPLLINFSSTRVVPPEAQERYDVW